MTEQIYTGRANINFDGLSLKILIPSKKNWFIILFLIIWLGGWTMGESSAISEISSSRDIFSNSFMLFWLIGWTIGGGFAFVVLVWSLLGQETITVDSRNFKIEKGILNIGLLGKDYDLKAIKNLELNPNQNLTNLFGQNKIADFWGLTGGKLRFDYGMKTIKFGIGIDEAEARFIFGEIVKRGFYKMQE